MIIVVYNGVSALVLPVAYNYWAILGLDIFAVVFWVISFPLLASEVGDYTVVTDDCVYEFDGYCYKKRWLSLEKRDTTNPTTYRNAMAAAAGLGGLELYVYILIFSHSALIRIRLCRAIPSSLDDFNPSGNTDCLQHFIHRHTCRLQYSSASPPKIRGPLHTCKERQCGCCHNRTQRC